MTTNRKRVVVVLAAAAVLIGAGIGVGQVSGSRRDQSDALLEGKAAAEGRADQVQKEARAKARGTTKPGRAGRPQPQPDPRPSTPGLVPVSSPFSSGQYLLDETGWQQTTASQATIVYAGALTSDPAQGVIIVSTWILPPRGGGVPAGPTMRATAYRTPSRIGPVEITSATGTVLVLQTSDRTKRLRFDAATRTYLP
jgi:hypothetical protein